MKNTKLITMIEGAIIAGVCVALSFIPLNTATASFDISLGLIPLVVYSLRRGAVPGITVGLVWGLLLIVIGKAYVLTIPQVVLEYPVAFALGGLGGIFAGSLHKKLSAQESVLSPGVIMTVIFAGAVSAVARWFVHFWAGVIFWGSYAPEGMSPYLYSFIFNGASAVANAVMLAIVLSVLIRTAKKLFLPKDLRI
jgi:putative proton-coupled thiamine transporter YuaJ